jgi:hypothetical protein
MRSEAERRRRHTADERAEILACYHRSGLTQGEFAARNALSLSCLSSWLRQARRTEREPSRPTLLRLPVDLTAGGRPGPAYRIVFPGGPSLEVATGFRIDELRELCQLLRGP